MQDIDCMPLNPEENLPASLTRHGLGIKKYMENLNECKTSALQAENAMEGYIKFHQENLDATNGFSHIPPPNFHALRQSQVRNS